MKFIYVDFNITRIRSYTQGKKNKKNRWQHWV